MRRNAAKRWWTRSQPLRSNRLASRSCPPWVLKSWLRTLAVGVILGGPTAAQPPEERLPQTQSSVSSTDDTPQSFGWTTGDPVLGIDPDRLPPSRENPWHAVKDPTVVHDQDRWHLFCTLRKRDGGTPGYIRIGYLSFSDWSEAGEANWELLDLSPEYHAAPQVFFFAPHNKWYLVYQLADASRGIAFGPCYSTTDDINDPKSWSKPQPLYDEKPAHVKGWLDFWIICDDAEAHLFFTSLDGRMWRAETSLTAFPGGFGSPQVVLRGDIFEASHTYRVGDTGKYWTIVEAQGSTGDPPRGRRYFKAYVADSLDGRWEPLAATPRSPFAAAVNVKMTGTEWTDSISHGELIRAGHNQQLEIDPRQLRFLFQGLPDEQWQGGYGKLSWRLGILEAIDIQ